MIEKITAGQVAKWFICRANEDAKNGGDYFSPLRLNLFMYYAKGFYYVFKDESLFDSLISVKENAVLINSIARETKRYGANIIKRCFSNEKNIQDKQVLNVLNFVYSNLSKFSTAYLFKNLKGEQTWKNALKNNNIISNEDISEYFKKEFLSDDGNKFDIPVTDIKIVFENNVFIQYDGAFRELAKM